MENAAKNGRDSTSEALPARKAAYPPNSPADPAWYAIQTRYRFERKVTAALDRKGLETFIPLLSETHHWSDRKKVIQQPLFSGYTFARLTPSTAQQKIILQTAGVTGFVSVGNEMTPIPTHQLENLRNLLSRKAPCSLAPFLNIGQHVRIHGGCLDGIEGILTRNDAKHLIISIDFIQRSLAIEIDGYQLEPI
ncbi:MAG TPA: UpxY family transcription antiterminator [Terriglobales bacterium]